MRGWLMAVLLAATGAAHAQGADVGLVSLVAGDVSYIAADGATGKVKAFMKVREGDRINLDTGAQLRVVFFDGARQERWAGPASFRAGKVGSTSIAGAPAEVVTLPAGVQQRIARVPDLVQHARLGGIQVRGGPSRQLPGGADQAGAISAARDTYAQMQKSVPDDDITPELFLYAALSEYQLYDDMKAVVADMRRKQPENEDIRTLETWVATRTAR
jgi:hypothetical protein